MTEFLNSNHYKDKSPTETVQNIIKILKKIDITLIEEWSTDIEYIFSLRVTVLDTSIGSNGKGVTKELARASAYSEFMERYQNLWLFRWNYLWETDFNFRYFCDEKYLSAEDIINSNTSFINNFFNQRFMENAMFDEKVMLLKKMQKMDFNFSEEKNKFLSLPFYNLKLRKTEYLPYYLYSSYYLSNGMCAGNTAEEAIVQGISEIMERYVQKLIIKEKIPLPNITYKYLSKFPYVKKLFDQLKLIKGYEFVLKNCTLNDRFPVAGLLIIEKNTGNYGIKFGCHPNFGIAMERAITEAAQGNDLIQYSQRSKLDFNNNNVIEQVNILNGFKSGTAQYPYEIFDNFTECDPNVYDVSNLTNKEILIKMQNVVFNDGYEIIIRDVSYLDFPTFHVIIPGMSEVMDVSDKWFNALNTKFHVHKLLNSPSKINESNAKYIIGIMDYFANSQLDNSMKSHFGVLPTINFPGEEYNLGWLYYTAMCFILLNDYKSACDRMAVFIQISATKNPYYISLYQYLQGMVNLNNHSRVINILNQFFDLDICEKINFIFNNPQNAIINQYSQHNYLDFKNCENNKCCDYYSFKEIVEKYKKIQVNNRILQSKLDLVFK